MKKMCLTCPRFMGKVITANKMMDFCRRREYQRHGSFNEAETRKYLKRINMEDFSWINFWRDPVNKIPRDCDFKLERDLLEDNV